MNQSDLVAKCAEAGWVAARDMAVAQLSTGAQVSTLPKGLDYVAFDTDFIEATQTAGIRFFQSNTFINGGAFAGTNKSQADFNLDSPGKFNSPNSFYQIGIRFTLLPDPTTNEVISANDFLNLKRNAWFTYIAGQRPVFRVKLDQISGLNYETVMNVNSNIQNLQLGSAESDQWVRFGQPLPNYPNQTFTWLMEFSPDFRLQDADRVRVRVSLPGILEGAAG